MSKEVAKQIIKRTKEDSTFLENLLKDPDGTLKDYDLDDTERKFFRTADKKAIEGLKDNCFELTN